MTTLSAEELPAAFQRVQGKYIEVITDMPTGDDLRELSQVFDAAVPLWCEVFDVPLSDVQDWRVEAFIMLDRQRFLQAGVLPDRIADFPFGFQLGDRLWVAEQPSAYYRRHLLLHEGTHWFMARKFGRQGPPWLMEGVAEWLGTHRWDGRQLTLGVVPASPDEVAYWGRIKLIQQDLAGGLAPSLETVLRYGNSAHRQVEAYAWSWAAVLFLRSDPLGQVAFTRLLEGPLLSTEATNRWLFKSLAEDWPELRQRWNAFLSELEYGCEPSLASLKLTQAIQPLKTPVEVSIRADRGWQPSGIQVQAGDKVRIEASGKFALGRSPRPWESHAAGVSLQYYRGQPLGKLLLAVAAPLPREPQFAAGLQRVPVGEGGEFSMTASGELFFRVNEPSGELADNTGSLTIVIQP